MIRFFTDNLIYKVVALLFALILWAFVKGTDKTIITATLPLAFQDVPQGVTVVSNADYIEVQVSGPSTILSGRLFQQSRVELLVETKPLGQETILTLGAEHIRVPFGLDILSIKPSIVRYYLETVVPVNAAVVPSLMGGVAEGYEVTSVQVEPETVRLMVPENEREHFSAIRTAPLSIHQLKETKRIHTALSLPPSIHWDAQEITITVEIAEKTVQRSLRNIPVMLESNQRPPVDLSVNVVLEGKYHTMATIRAAALYAVMDTQSQQIIAIQGLPAGVHLVESDPLVVPQREPEREPVQ